ncbi:MAG: aldo/keto reductase [Planctomycetota bacterium]|nr:MAG: aldo/keto reductase [Planctomycetota bacterium]
MATLSPPEVLVSDSIRNFHPQMAYRRFGKTEQQLSVITLGGMRFRELGGEPRAELSTPLIDQCAEVTQLALDRGINHIETAYGYGKSEHAYGMVLNEVMQVPRDRYVLMTKGKRGTADDMRRLVDEQLRALRTDRIDLYGVHGINLPEHISELCASGGAVEELHKMVDEGIIGSVGFSTHGPLEVIIDALATGMFSFLNVHYYYFLQRNRGAVDYAGAKDIGVFIISPNDKGGRLFEPSQRLQDLCTPLTPIQFNAKWCLNHPHISTLSFGLTEREHFVEMDGIFPLSLPLSAEELAIKQRMDNAILADPLGAYEGFELINDPSGINIPEVLRHRRMATCYGQDAFGHYRYNMFQAKGDWFPGEFATPERVEQVDTSRAPQGFPLKDLLNDTHQRFYKSQSTDN